MHVFEDDFAVAPDAISLTKLLEIVAVEAGNGRAGLRDAERVMDIMRRKGVVPSRISWNVVLSVVVRYAELEPKVDSAKVCGFALAIQKAQVQVAHT